MDIKSSLRTLPLLWLSIIFLVGVVLASLLSAALWIWVVLAILVAAVGFGLRKRTSEFQLFSLTAICILLFGAARYQVAQPNFDSDDLATYNDSANLVEITGTLEKPAAPRDGYVELIVRAEKLRLPDNNELSVDGFVLARTDLGVDWNYGDQIRISGELTTPAEYEDFSYRDYLARQGVYSLVPFAAVERLETGRGNPFWAIMYGVRERGLETLYRLYPAREAALLAGILLGDESGLSEQVKTDFNDTGTRHIIAISGFNISIIAGLLLAASSRWLPAAAHGLLGLVSVYTPCWSAQTLP